MICPKCGKEIADDTKFCGFCQAKLNSKSKKKTDPTASIVLTVIIAVAALVIGFTSAMLVFKGTDNKTVTPAATEDNSFSAPEEISDYAAEAKDVLHKHWKGTLSDIDGTDGTLKIVNTTVYTLKETNTPDFADVVAVVIFDIECDYYGSAPYYTNPGIDNCVVFYENGKTDVTKDIFSMYVRKTFNTDFSEIIDEAYDLGSRYDTVFDLK